MLNQKTFPQTDSQHSQIDQTLDKLQANCTRWARLSIAHKISYLVQIRKRTHNLAERWVETAVAAKGLPANSPLAGEEWASGPWSLIYTCNHYIRTLEKVMRGEDLLADRKMRTRPNGQLLINVMPTDNFDDVLLNGITAEVWMQPGVTPTNVRDTMATFYQQSEPEGNVALILGAGNIASIPPLDMLYKLFVEGEVCLVKMNPVNAYLGEFFEEIFGPMVYEGFVGFAYGGGDVGGYLTSHEAVDTIHITGSEKTHDVIMYGRGAEGAARKANDERLIDKPITSELGGIGATIVVPGPWTADDIQFQAENIVTQKLHNCGYNCSASQVLVLSYDWTKSATLLGRVRQLLHDIPPRTPYYPGALERQQGALNAYPNAELIDPPTCEVPRVLITGLNPEGDEYAYREEFFGGVYAQVSMSGRDPETFLRKAVKFANEKLHGTLTCNIIIHPQTIEELGSTFDDIVAEMRFGAIGINAWSSVVFNLASGTWGAFPGHTYQDVQSGIGVVHNALMFDKPEKTVVRAPFAPAPRAWQMGELHTGPKPVWFVTNKQADVVAKYVTKFAADGNLWHVPKIIAAALKG